MPKPTQTVCGNCGSRNVEVLDSRETEHGRRRRRGCLACGHRWTTYEVAAEEMMGLKSAQRRLNELLKRALQEEQRRELDELDKR